MILMMLIFSEFTKVKEIMFFLKKININNADIFFVNKLHPKMAVTTYNTSLPASERYKNGL